MSIVAQLKALLWMDNSQYKAKAKESTDVTSRMQSTIASTDRIIHDSSTVATAIGANTSNKRSDCSCKPSGSPTSSTTRAHNEYVKGLFQKTSWMQNGEH